MCEQHPENRFRKQEPRIHSSTTTHTQHRHTAKNDKWNRISIEEVGGGKIWSAQHRIQFIFMIKVKMEYHRWEWRAKSQRKPISNPQFVWKLENCPRITFEHIQQFICCLFLNIDISTPLNDSSINIMLWFNNNRIAMNLSSSSLNYELAHLALSMTCFIFLFLNMEFLQTSSAIQFNFVLFFERRKILQHNNDGPSLMNYYAIFQSAWIICS